VASTSATVVQYVLARVHILAEYFKCVHQKVRSVQMIIICWLICYFSVKLGIFIKINVV
jgi:hypothetical protein